jgi:hypothetical protein
LIQKKRVSDLGNSAAIRNRCHFVPFVSRDDECESRGGGRRRASIAAAGDPGSQRRGADGAPNVNVNGRSTAVMNLGAVSVFSVQVPAMEPIAILAMLVAAGWAVWKTGSAMRTLRERQPDSDSSGRSEGYGSGAGGIDPGGSSGHGHGGGDCGGHGGGDGGGHGGW